MISSIIFGPIIVMFAFIIYAALTKKRPSDKFNSKISSNLKEYEKDMDNRYKL